MVQFLILSLLIFYLIVLFFITIIYSNDPDQIISYYEKELIDYYQLDIKHSNKIYYINDIEVYLHSIISKENKNNEKDVLLLLHGTTGSCMSYAKIFNELSKEYIVHAIDIPGFGRSHYSLEYNQLAMIYKDTAEFLIQVIVKYIKEIGTAQTLTLCGHSFGGYLAIMLAKQEPNLIHRLILINPAGIFPVLSEYGMYWAYFFKWGIPYIHSNANSIIHDIFPNAGEYSYWFHLLGNPKCTGQYFISDKISMTNDNTYWNKFIVNYFDIIKCPVKLIYCEYDLIIPKEQGMIISKLFGHKLYILNTGHNPIGTSQLTEIINNKYDYNPINNKCYNIQLNESDFKATFNITRMKQTINNMYSVIQKSYLIPD